MTGSNSKLSNYQRVSFGCNCTIKRCQAFRIAPRGCLASTIDKLLGRAENSPGSWWRAGFPRSIRQQKLTLKHQTCGFYVDFNYNMCDFTIFHRHTYGFHQNKHGIQTILGFSLKYPAKGFSSKLGLRSIAKGRMFGDLLATTTWMCIPATNRANSVCIDMYIYI